MPATLETATHEPSQIEFSEHPPSISGGLRRWRARMRNVRIDWLHADADDANHVHESSDETMLVALDAPVTIVAIAHDASETTSRRIDTPPRSVCILAPGRWRLQPAPGATCIVLATLRDEAAPDAINQSAYAVPDPRIKTLGNPYLARRDDAARVTAIDEVQVPADKPGLKRLQSATLSINWVEYDGPRDPSALSPHSHADFEQGALAVAGDFVHHLRVPWGPDSRLWREDRHVRLGPSSLLVVPAQTVHTTEGVGSGRHLMIEVFSPPRADFIAKGLIINAADYRAPESA